MQHELVVLRIPFPAGREIIGQRILGVNASLALAISRVNRLDSAQCLNCTINVFC